MSDEELSRLLSELQSNAKRLNDESDGINSIISSVEQKIGETNVGLECWLDSDPLYTGKPTPIPLGPQGDEGATWSDMILGYAKVEGGWKLAVMQRGFAAEVQEWGQSSDAPSPDCDDPTALSRASRSLRIEALKKLPALLRVILDAVEESLEAIASAKKLVE